MIEIDPPDVYGYTTFSDDVRFEIDGKVTLVGCYHGEMIVRGDFPATLAKFAMSVVFNQKKEAYDANLKLHVFFPGDPDNEPGIVIDVEAPQEMPFKTDKPNIGARANLVLSPLIIQSPGMIRVRMLRQGKYHKIGNLVVSQANPTSSNERPPLLSQSPPDAPAS